MLVQDTLTRFQFDHESFVHEEISVKISQYRPVAILHLNRILLLNLEPMASQTMKHAVFIHILPLPIFQPSMQIQSLRPDNITPPFYHIIASSFNRQQITNPRFDFIIKLNILVIRTANGRFRIQQSRCNRLTFKYLRVSVERFVSPIARRLGAV